MIEHEMIPNALHALQAALIYARSLSYQPEENAKELTDLLDSLEVLPDYIVRYDNGAAFRRELEVLVQKFGCHYVLQKYDNES